MGICNICGGKGVIPFKKKCKIIPNVLIDCECKQDDIERYYHYNPDSFDFAMSETWRKFYDETLYGIPGKGKMIPEKGTIVSPEVTPRSSELTHIRTLLTETRDAQQAHFKHHSGTGKKRKPFTNTKDYY